jgi:tryptophanyl-tRNA synthetase
MNKKKVILTGDRPTGALHLGHYVGSLQARVKLQDEMEQYVLIADVQALTDHYDDPEGVRRNIDEVMLDYLAVGLDPAKTTFVLQSAVPEIAELSVYFLNLVSLAHLQLNPTVKEEMKQKGYGNDVPAGFLTYPVHQAADITVFNADVVPVGEDQLPVIEQAREIVRAFNRIYGQTLTEPNAMLSKVKRLPGVDGKAKMSKSLGNTIELKASEARIKEMVNKMYTDPQKIHVEDPGHLEGNVVFQYLDVFDQDKAGLDDLKQRYVSGKTGDGEGKKRLAGILNDLIGPFRERRAQLEKDPKALREILRAGTAKARIRTGEVMGSVRKALRVDYFS